MMEERDAEDWTRRRLRTRCFGTEENYMKHFMAVQKQQEAMEKAIRDNGLAAHIAPGKK